MLRYIVHKYVSKNIYTNSFEIVKKCAFEKCKYKDYNIVTEKMMNLVLHQNRCLFICDKCKSLIIKD